MPALVPAGLLAVVQGTVETDPAGAAGVNVICLTNRPDSCNNFRLENPVSGNLLQRAAQSAPRSKIVRICGTSNSATVWPSEE